MENPQTTSTDTNIKTQSDTDGFNIPVSTAPSPMVSDFKPPVTSSSDSLANPKPQSDSSNIPTSDSTFSTPISNPLPSFDIDKGSSTISDSTDQSKSKLSAPIHGQNYGGKGSKTMTMILGLIILLVIVGGIYGVYSWQHSKVVATETMNSALNSQVSSLQTQLTSAQKNLASAQAALNSNVINIAALGFSLNVPNSLKDLTVATKANPTKLTVNGASVTPTEVTLSSTSLATLDSACSTANAALGTISKTTGTYPTAPTATNSSGTLVEQFSTYYLAYSAPTACSKITATNSTQTTLVNTLKSALIQANITVAQ
jgi:hypothetical protein